MQFQVTKFFLLSLLLFSFKLNAQTCTANFSVAGSYTQFQGDTISFYDSSVVKNPLRTSRNWDFGDTTYGAGLNPSHVYKHVGKYTVRLIIYDSVANCQDTTASIIHIVRRQSCDAKFTLNKTSIYESDSVFLDAKSSKAAHFANLEYTWKFGDGNTKLGPMKLYHTYSTVGKYNITLFIRDTIERCRDSFKTTVNVIKYCKSSFYYIRAGITTDDTVYFYGNNSRMKFPAATSFTWDFGDGTIATSGITTKHLYTKVGNFSTSLIIYDSLNYCADTFFYPMSIVVTGPPECEANIRFNFRRNYFAGDTVVFLDSSIITNPSSTSYNLNFGDGNFSTKRDSAVGHAYSASGFYRVTLVVEDSIKACIDSQTVYLQVRNDSCHAFMQITGSGYFNNRRYFNASNSITKNPKNTVYFWDFGDGNKEVGSDTTSHLYSAPGKYNVSLISIDTIANCTDSTTRELTLYAPPKLCKAQISYKSNKTKPTAVDTLFFSDNSIVKDASATSYTWFFSNGKSKIATSKEIIPQVFKTGTQSAFLLITDSSIGCSDSILLSFVVYEPTKHCDARFYLKPAFGGSQTSNLDTIVFHNTSYVSFPQHSSVKWKFGDGSSAFGNQVEHFYPDSGIYKVVISVIDSFENCKDSMVKKVKIAKFKPCQASYQIKFDSKDSNCSYTFTSYTQWVDSNTRYTWRFGDGDSAVGIDLKRVSHTFLSSKTYQTVLLLKGQRCSSYKENELIVAPNCTTSTVTINGLAYCDTFLARSGIAYLIQKTADSLFLVDSNRFVFGQFSFTVPTGNYYVKVALDKTDSLYTKFIPTYYGDVLTWDSASTITAKGVTSIKIQMVKGINPGGSGFIGGDVKKGANKREGEPLSGIELILTDESGNPVGYTYSDAKGKFTFASLPYGVYDLTCDIPGIVSDHYRVIIDEEHPSIESILVEVNSNLVTFQTSIGNDVSAFQFTAYPNPTSEVLNIQISTQQNGDQLIIYNSLGQMVMKHTAVTTNQIDVNNLEPGVYIIMLETLNPNRKFTPVQFIKY